MDVYKVILIYVGTLESYLEDSGLRKLYTTQN